MRDFSTMKNNVGTDIQDTSSVMAVTIGRYLNKRYFDVLKLSNFQAINKTHTITLATLATLPSDFGKELYCMDGSNNPYTRIEIEQIAQETPTDTNYAIFSDQNGVRQIMTWNTEDTTLKLPYIVKPVELSGNTDTPLIPCESILEVGAIADCWRYKRQFAKAQAMEVMFADMLSNFIWDYENQPAQQRQFTPITYSRDLL
jgi:hypothetical protein